MFPPEDAARLLARCHRRCCVCHRFCGVKIELDHIEQRVDGGSDDIENAIPVCFECHAEIHSYNDRHPRGRKFRPDELRLHKQQWLDICERSPHLLLQAPYDRDVGPLQALLDELEFNRKVAAYSGDWMGCPFRDQQFSRAISEGAVAVLDDSLKEKLIHAYVGAGRANEWVASALQMPRSTSIASAAISTAERGLREAAGPINAAIDALLAFLSPS
jgi:HNH endonuclease